MENYQYEYLIVTVEDRLARVVLNRPEVSNALATKEFDEIEDCITRMENDPDVGAILISGAGKNFCAGGDINRFKQLLETGEGLYSDGIYHVGKMTRAITFCTKPVIAMVNGAAAGGGFSIALACDFRIASPSSKFVMSFINIGLPADTGSMYNLNRLVGGARAVEIMRLGEPIRGERAYEIGLVTRLVPDESLEEEAVKFAGKLAHGPLQAYKRQKMMENAFFRENYEAYSIAESVYMLECSHTKDFAEAINAFLEKRKPEFTGE